MEERSQLPLFCEEPPMLLSPIHLFSKFVQLLPFFSVNSNRLSHCFSSAEWEIAPLTFGALFYLMILWINTCWTLVTYYQKDLDVCFVQQRVNFDEVWYIMWIFDGTLIWYHTHTHRHITHSGANSLTHPYKCIFTPPVTCLFMQTPPFLWESPLFLFFENSENLLPNWKQGSNYEVLIFWFPLSLSAVTFDVSLLLSIDIKIVHNFVSSQLKWKKMGGLSY